MARRRICAILGGMGPLSGGDLSRKIIEESGAEKDQEHLFHIIVVNPRVPDRTEHLLGNGKDFVPSIVQQCRQAYHFGTDFVAIPCNTAHAKINEIREGSPIPVLDMIEETALHARALMLDRRFGVLGTKGALKLDLYGRHLRAHGLEVAPTPEAITVLAHEAGYVVKAGNLSRGRMLAFEAASLMRREGADAIILACTELPVALGPFLRRDGCEDLIDPTRILARAIIRESGS